jgi:hypothetical protein
MTLAELLADARISDQAARLVADADRPGGELEAACEDLAYAALRCLFREEDMLDEDVPAVAHAMRSLVRRIYVAGAEEALRAREV